MIDHLLAENHLMPEFEQYGLDKRDIVFIKELIGGPQAADLKDGHESDGMDEENEVRTLILLQKVLFLCYASVSLI